jgi:AcrR family transcriptional regulator
VTSSQDRAGNPRLEAARSADRPRSHAGDSETERAIFEATERLLAERALQDLSVAQIIDAAGISRATFYFYFSSKYAVVTGLLAAVMDEIYDVMAPFVRRPGTEVPEGPLRESLTAAAGVWHAHSAALRAVMEHWHAVPELRTLWLGVVRRFADGLAHDIELERTRGLAPAGTDSRALATALIWGTERCFYVAGFGADSDLPDEQAAVEPLLALWLGTIYGPPEPRRARRAAKGAHPRPAKSAARRRNSGAAR